MRILTYTSLFPDSTRPNFGVFIYQRMAHVAKRGNRVMVVAPVPWVPGWIPGSKANKYRNVPRQEQFGGLEVHHPRYLLLPKVGLVVHGLLMFLCTYRITRRLVREGCDCIDGHFVYPDGYAAALIGRLLKVPVVVSARGTDMNLYPTMAAARPWLKWTVRHADGLIGVCTALSDAMVDLGAPPARVRTIGNGVDRARFFPVDQSDARARLGIAKDAKIVLSVGALIERKGHHRVIPAMAQLKQQGLRLHFYIAGEGEWRSQLEAQARDLGVQDQVTLLGAIPNDQLKDWYSAADVSCLASSREGWANVLLESMACGTPVVATRIWGTPEVVVSDRLGLLVEQTSESIAAGLKSAFNTKWDRNAIAAFAHERSWESVAQQVEQWLTQCTTAAINTTTQHDAAGARA